MSNHIHLIWQPMFGFTPTDIQSSFMKYTAQQLKRSLTKNNMEALAIFKVNKYDREYQFWKREPLGIEMISPAVFEQKLDYIPDRTASAGRALQSCKSRLVYQSRRLLLFICKMLL